jgi:hypothetical protein
MNKLAVALAAAVTLASAAVVAPTAEACGGYGAYLFQPDRAEGAAPSVVRKDGSVTLETQATHFVVSGVRRDAGKFIVADDPTLRGLEQRLAARPGVPVVVTVEQLSRQVWRVTGWRNAARQG